MPRLNSGSRDQGVRAGLFESRHNINILEKFRRLTRLTWVAGVEFDDRGSEVNGNGVTACCSSYGTCLRWTLPGSGCRHREPVDLPSVLVLVDTAELSDADGARSRIIVGVQLRARMGVRWSHQFGQRLYQTHRIQRDHGHIDITVHKRLLNETCEVVELAARSVPLTFGKAEVTVGRLGYGRVEERVICGLCGDRPKRQRIVNPPSFDAVTAGKPEAQFVDNRCVNESR